MASELMACPFCGGDAKTKLPYVRCTNCGAQMCFGDSDKCESSIAAWNRRAQPQQVGDANLADLLDRLYSFLHSAWDAADRELREGTHGADLHQFRDEVYAAAKTLQRVTAAAPKASP